MARAAATTVSGSRPGAARRRVSRAAAYSQDPEALRGGHPAHVPALVPQPGGQGVGSQVLEHYQPGLAVVGQQRQPVLQQGVQGLLADAYRGIGPDEIHRRRALAQLGQQRVGRGDTHAVQACGSGVASGQRQRALVDIGGQDPCLRSGPGQGQRDRPPAAAQVEERAGLGRIGNVIEEDLGALVEAVGAEDSRGRDHRVLDAADREPVSALLGLDGGGGGEVVLAHTRQATRVL